ncbi:hypothetical protein J1N35_001926 [Gossypium stocksii]|uniref:RNase H type-1 domain-containing protein n=1 Tax=Gossypium stocksii TaxID=47602 RepID=A0A9D4AMU1_9ROSI|nr:hypothetical protein J1N35_001926 [Gossypium stocksii]
MCHVATSGWLKGAAERSYLKDFLQKPGVFRIEIQGGALLSTLSIHLGSKLKQALNTKQQYEASTRSKGVEGSSELVRNIPIKWKSPSHGWVKITIDGTFDVKGNWSAIGGVTRFYGNWIAGFRNVRGSTLTTGLWAILYGLEIVWQKG